MNAPDQQDRRKRGTGTQPADRRGDDRDAPQADAARTGRAGRPRFRRLRQPLIGLGLAGIAVPMVRATTAAENDPEEADGVTAEFASARPATGQDTEEELAERIATTREERERQSQVDRAVERYAISRDLAEDIYDIARESNIEPRLAYGLVKTESTFDERAVSPVGARGLTQVMPRTAAWLVPGTRTQDLHDRQTNLRLGFTYLDQMIAKYKGNVRLALLAYNRGPGTVDKVLKKGGNPDNGYADKVLRG